MKAALVALCLAGCALEPPEASELLAVGDPPPCGLVSKVVDYGAPVECWRVEAPPTKRVTAPGEVDGCEAEAAGACVVTRDGAVRLWWAPLSDDDAPLIVTPVPCDVGCPER